MAFAPTFFANGFGICVDPFGIPWMVISPKEM
jgi:PhnB protein